ncbi:hypothetical protein [Pseudorhizobium marinum]|uniref:hypothetical protein n=1 Tax=Pseudorhizobium marinum TaxID=1496690 RepID=UPI0012DD9830|nr:hypothetical protein [Pseudorhizobium marinum]
MWTWVGKFLLSVGLAVSCVDATLGAVPDASVLSCRERFAKDLSPNGSGGWSVVEGQGGPVLCLAGSLVDIDLPKLLMVLRAMPRLDIVVRTTGGPVDLWLSIAENLIGRIGALYVDEACFSSCANYLLPIADKVIAESGSLIVWHGGPNPWSSQPLAGAEVTDAIEYDQLSNRTKRLYEAVGADVRLLAYTSEPPSPKKLVRLFGAESGEVTVSGYALSPIRLAECFGFRNLKSMWHAGGDRAVYELGRSRSEHLTLLETPQNDSDGTVECD